MKNIRLLFGDCLEIMNETPDKSVDFICSDLPYGTTKCAWDEVIPLNSYVLIDGKYYYYNEFLLHCFKKNIPYDDTLTLWKENSKKGMWEHFNRIIKDNGAIALFGQEPFSSTLRKSNIKDYKFDWYWEKERLTNVTQVKKRAGKTIETISMFYKMQPTYNPQMIKYNGPKRTNKVKNGKLGYLIDENNKSVTEYIDTGWRYPTQVLHFKRDFLKCNLHKTQKPVALLENLIKTYTNEGEVVLDNCE